MTTLLLAATQFGDGPPLAILHGLFGSGRNWAGIARRLAARHRVIALDLRNHGASPWSDSMDYAEMAADVKTTLLTLGHRRFALIGHSMGGKVAMLAALLYGEDVERLVVADIAPVPYPPRHLGLVRALRRVDLAGLRRRGEADARLAAEVPDPAERAFLLQNLVFDGDVPGGPSRPEEGRQEAGTARWRITLAAIEREMPALAGFPAVPPDTAYAGPALFVGGERSDYLASEYEPAVRRFFPNATIVRIPNAGHWLHAEQPQAFLDLVGPFLAG